MIYELLIYYCICVIMLNKYINNFYFQYQEMIKLPLSLAYMTKR